MKNSTIKRIGLIEERYGDADLEEDAYAFARLFADIGEIGEPEIESVAQEFIKEGIGLKRMLEKMRRNPVPLVKEP